MRSHLLGMLEPASVLQVNRHTGRAPSVTPDRRQKPRVARSFPNRCPGIVPIQRTPAKRGPSLVHALKQRLLVLNTDFVQVISEGAGDGKVDEPACFFETSRQAMRQLLKAKPLKAKPSVLPKSKATGR